MLLNYQPSLVDTLDCKVLKLFLAYLNPVIFTFNYMLTNEHICRVLTNFE